jgi:hypothetical protein
MLDPDLSPDDLRAIIAEAYIYAYPMLDNYRSMYLQAIEPEAAEYIGGFNVIKNYSEPFTPDNHDVVTPNNDTPYSWARLDLRAEPFVISVPAVPTDRYYVLEWFDLFTYIVGYIGSRTTGSGAGTYLLTGPDWQGTVPPGIDGVIASDTSFLALLGRTLLDGSDDVPAVQAIQSNYRLQPLSQFLGQAPPPAAAAVDWPVWHDEALTTSQFLPYLNFLLQFCQPPDPSETDLMARFARAGIVPGGAIDVASWSPPLRQAVEDGTADGIATLNAAIETTLSSNGLFGSRAQLGADYLKRAVGANKGLYGNAVEEAWYGGWGAGSDGQPLDGGKRYRLHFAVGQLPPARFFWSATMYDLPNRFLVDNPINRYSIGDRTAGLQSDADGGLTIDVAHASPGTDREANWLPAPAGPFTIIIRIYGPETAVLDGSWTLPPLEVVPGSGEDSTSPAS